MKVLHAPHAWLADGWQSDVRIAIDTGGTIRSVSHGAAQPDDLGAQGPPAARRGAPQVRPLRLQPRLPVLRLAQGGRVLRARMVVVR